MTKLIDLILEQPNVEGLLEDARKAYEREQRARAEFIEWLTPDVKAEFISGEVVLHSPAKESHLSATLNLALLLRAYADTHRSGKVRVEKALVRIGRNDFEPDVCCWTSEQTAGWTEDMMIYPAPDLVIEVLSKSTEDRDRGVKFDAYCTGGVAEYWIVDPITQTVEQYENSTGRGDVRKYQLQGTFDVTVVVPCLVLRGLELPVEAVFNDRKCLEEQVAILAAENGPAPAPAIRCGRCRRYYILDARVQA